MCITFDNFVIDVVTEMDDLFVDTLSWETFRVVNAF